MFDLLLLRSPFQPMQQEAQRFVVEMVRAISVNQVRRGPSTACSQKREHFAQDDGFVVAPKATATTKADSLRE